MYDVLEYSYCMYYGCSCPILPIRVSSRGEITLTRLDQAPSMFVGEFIISGHRIFHESTEIWVQMANKWQTDAGGLPFHVSESQES